MKIENISAEEACRIFEQLNPRMGEISDDELDNVAGGGCGYEYGSSPKYNSGDHVYFMHGEGLVGAIMCWDVSCTVIDVSQNNGKWCYNLRSNDDGKIHRKDEEELYTEPVL